MAVILEKFDTENPFSIDKVNANFAAIAAVVNSALGDTQLQFGSTPNANPEFLSIMGGTLLGQLTAPSLLIGTMKETKYPVVTTKDKAKIDKVGLIKQAAKVALLSQTISATPSQSEVQAISTALDGLISALISSEIMSPL